MKVGVATAVYLANEQHYKLAKETLETIQTDEHEIVTCGWINKAFPDWWREPFTERGHLHDNDENNVSRAWNRGIDCLINEEKCDFVFVPNLDIVVKPGSLDAFVNAAAKLREQDDTSILWTMANWHYRWDLEDAPGIAHAPTYDNWVQHPHFSAFMVDGRLFPEIGPFDETFRPAYNEDLDMHWRIRLAGRTALQYEGARFYHYGSQTIRNDPALNEANLASHQAGNLYFTQKWGFKPATADDPFTDGMFRFPFNDPARAGEERRFMKTW